MSSKKAVLNYEQYRKRYPDTKMTKTEYEKKYFSDVIDDVGRGIGQPTRSTSQAGPTTPPKEHPIHPEKHDPVKGFDALFKYMDAGNVKDADQASLLIRRLGYNEHEFANHLIKQVSEGKQDFNRLDQFVKLGIIPKSYVKRQIRFNDMEKRVPPKFYQEYGIDSENEWHVAPNRNKGKPVASIKNSVMLKILTEIQALEEDCDKLLVE